MPHVLGLVLQFTWYAHDAFEDVNFVTVTDSLAVAYILSGSQLCLRNLHAADFADQCHVANCC